jgi:hypothetical protein
MIVEENYQPTSKRLADEDSIEDLVVGRLVLCGERKERKGNEKKETAFLVLC